MNATESVLKRLKQSNKENNSKLSQHVRYQYQQTHPQHQITHIYQHCEFLLELESCFHKQIDPKWRPYIRIGHYELGKLTLITIDGSWLSIIQCFKKQWLDPLRSHPLFHQLHSITGHINPHLYSTILQSTQPNRSKVD